MTLRCVMFDGLFSYTAGGDGLRVELADPLMRHGDVRYISSISRKLQRFLSQSKCAERLTNFSETE